MLQKGERSRAKLVTSTATLLQRQGYHATGLAEIVAHSGAPRGSLYFYFPGGKEELACAALTESGLAWRKRLEEVADAAPDLPTGVRQVCELLGQSLEASGWSEACPMATVALEAAQASEAVRATCAEHFAGSREAIASRLVAAGIDRARAEAGATFALAAIEGALMLSKVHRSLQPLRDTAEQLALLIAMMTSFMPPSTSPSTSTSTSPSPSTSTKPKGRAKPRA